MKALRITLIVLLSIFMVIITCLFTYSFSFKEMVKEAAIDFIDIADMTENSVNLEETEGFNIDPKLKEVLKDKEVQSFIDKYTDITLEIFSGKDVNEVDFSKDFIELIESKKDLLNEAGLEIKDEDIQEFKNSDDYKELNEKYKEAMEEVVKNTDSEGAAVIRSISFLGTNSFRILCLVLIAISVVLIVLLSWSAYKWLLPIGINCVVSGSLTLIGSIFVSSVISVLLKTQAIRTVSLLISGGVLLVVGIIMIVIFAIVSSVIKGKVNEVS